MPINGPLNVKQETKTKEAQSTSKLLPVPPVHDKSHLQPVCGGIVFARWLDQGCSTQTTPTNDSVQCVAPVIDGRAEHLG